MDLSHLTRSARPTATEREVGVDGEGTEHEERGLEKWGEIPPKKQIYTVLLPFKQNRLSGCFSQQIGRYT